jgi:NTP pyrophosphohydrolases including oxidative damage repair enzymes
MKQQIKNIFRHYKKREISDNNLTPSAVLIPLFCHEGQIHILFTKRSTEVNSHKSQVCFPGGTYQPSDSSLLQTALREAEEEIGLKAQDVEIVGEFDDNVTQATGYIISPFVAFIPYPYTFTPNNKEVEQIFSVPLPVLMDDANFRQGYHPTEDKSGPGYAYEHEGHIIWGATARILKQFIELLRSESGAQ